MRTRSFNANYNSLQTSVTKRLSHGLEFLGSYTWSRNLDQTSGSSGSEVFETHLVTNDQTNFRQAYGPTDFDRTHRAVLSLVYNTSFRAPLPSLLSRVIGNWQISALAVAQSGTPITILDDSAGSVYGNYPFRKPGSACWRNQANHIRFNVLAGSEHLSQCRGIYFSARSAERHGTGRHRFWQQR